MSGPDAPEAEGYELVGAGAAPGPLGIAGIAGMGEACAVACGARGVPAAAAAPATPGAPCGTGETDASGVFPTSCCSSLSERGDWPTPTGAFVSGLMGTAVMEGGMPGATMCDGVFICAGGAGTEGFFLVLGVMVTDGCSGADAFSPTTEGVMLTAALAANGTPAGETMVAVGTPTGTSEAAVVAAPALPGALRSGVTFTRGCVLGFSVKTGEKYFKIFFFLDTNGVLKENESYNHRSTSLFDVARQPSSELNSSKLKQNNKVPFEVVTASAESGLSTGFFPLAKSANFPFPFLSAFLSPEPCSEVSVNKRCNYHTKTENISGQVIMYKLPHHH